VQYVLLTRGDQGVCVNDQQQVHFIPAIPVNAVDTTAAGDAFVGAFAAAIAHGRNALAAAQEAQYCAAFTVTQLGAQSAIPYRAEVERFKATFTHT
jgi:ribokinase